MTKYWVMVCLYTFISLIACETNPEEVIPKDDGTQQQDDDPDNIPTQNQPDPNDLISSLICSQSSKISGDIPVSSNLADLKIESDSIFWVEGINKTIKIRFPDMFVEDNTSLLMQVVDSDAYIKIEEDEEASTDSIKVYSFCFNTDNWNPPLYFDTDIAVANESGLIIDSFLGRTMVIDEKGESDCSPIGHHWAWIYTNLNGVLNVREGISTNAPGTVSGCCDSGGNSFYGVCAEDYTRVIDYENKYTIEHESVNFIKDGTFTGLLVEKTHNIAPSQSDFCGGKAGYREGIMNNNIAGNFTYDQNTKTIKLSNIVGEIEQVEISPGSFFDVPKPVFISDKSTFEIISCHFMVERKPGNAERYFERRTQSFIWYD